MAQDVDKIIKLLHEMQRSNNANADSFDRLLLELADKFDSVNPEASAELMNAYISELAKSVDDKYSVTLAKFQDIEQALKAVYNNQSDAVKNSDMKELFELFSKNVNNFYTEARQEKAILAGIESKLADLLSNKSDKNDIIRTISLLKNDFENMNQAYKSTIDNVNTNLKSILSNLINLDPTKSGDTAKAQIEIMYHAVNDIVNKIQGFEEKGDNLEKILSNVATNKDLKITKGIIDSIIAKTYEIEQILKDVSDKDDMDEIRKALEYINKKADRTATADEFVQIRDKADGLLSMAEEVKVTLGKIASDIENVPVGEELENAMKKLYSQLDELGQSVESSSVKDEMDIVSEKLESLQNELELIKNIINDLNDAITSRVISAIESMSFGPNSEDLKEAISKIIESLPNKEDIDSILQNNNTVFQSLLDRTVEISEKLDSIPAIEENIQSISESQKNLSQQISDINFEKEFSYIYDKTTSIESWLIDSNIKENSEKIAAQIQGTPSLASLEELSIRTNQIIESLEELSKSKNVDNVGDNLAQIDANVLEIINLLKNSSIHDDNIEISDKLEDLERSISEIVSRNEFNDFIEELKYCITRLSTNTGSCTENIEQMIELRKGIEDKLNSFDFSQVLRVLNGKFDQLQSRLSDSITEEVIENIQSGVHKALSANEVFEDINKKVSEVETKIDTTEQSIVSIDEFIKSNLPMSEDYLKSQIDEIKNLITTRAAHSHGVQAGFDGDDIDIIKDYLDDIRSIVSQDPNDELIYKISSIEDMISVHHTFYENAFSSIIERLDLIKSDMGSIPEDAKQLSQSVSEISTLADSLSSMKKAGVIGSAGDQSFTLVEDFLNDKFEDLTNSLSGMVSKSSGDGNFVYKSVLSEEKLNALIDFVNDMKEKSENVDAKSLDELNDQLSDFKQELQLVSTDIKQYLSSKITELLGGITSVKEDAQKLNGAEDTDEIEKSVEALYTDVMQNELSSQNVILLNALHDKFSKKLQESQNDLKDVVLSDTDSIIIKLEALREYVEKSLANFVPPDAEDMAEIKSFRAELEDFKSSFEHSLKETADSIISYISLQNDDLKSLISISNNHDDIIDAIEGLKSYFRKIKAKASDDGDAVEIDDSAVNSADYDDLCSKFKDFSSKIEKLSDDNESISKVLDLISLRLEETYAPKNIDDDFLDSDIEDDKSVSGFDFVKAFEILQKDITSLKASVSRLRMSDSKPSEVDGSGESESYDTVKEANVEEFLTNINETWLDDIKNFITFSNDALEQKIDVINSKLDLMVSDTANTDLLENISDTVVEVDEKISGMLEELNNRIAEISGSANAEDIAEVKNLIVEQQNYIKNLEPSEKLDAFKKCLDELTVQVTNLSGPGAENITKSVKEMKDSLMNAVVTIFDQVSFVEESEDIKDFVEERTDEINKNIEQITKQLQQMSSTVPNDYNYSLQDIETDLAKLRLALNDLKVNPDDTVHQDDVAMITDKLHSISELVDSLTQDEMKELKSEISALKEQTQFLIATSDKSYNALNSGIAGFEGIINDSLTGKVDQVTKMLEKSADSDNVIKQALIYMGEWIDSASDNINKISDNSEEIAKINDNLKMLKSSINTEVTQSIENKFDLWNANLQKLERQISKVENLEEQFARQQDRIDRLEMNIDKLVSMVENMDDSTSIRKIDKIEKQLSKLGTSIEKLTSYVE